MKKPTPIQVTEYAKSIDFDLDGNLFCDYYISCGWTVGKNKPMKNWEAAVRYWKRVRQKDEKAYNYSKGPDGLTFRERELKRLKDET